MLYLGIVLAAVAGYVVLQWGITPLDRYLSKRLWRNVAAAHGNSTRHRPHFALRTPKARPLRPASPTLVRRRKAIAGPAPLRPRPKRPIMHLS